MQQVIIGRVAEQEKLTQLFGSSRSEFLAIYGRRRVGKTFLIKNFFESKECVFFYCSGLKDGKLSEQLQEFTRQIGITFYNGADIAERKSWQETFEDLNKAMLQIAASKKIVLFFDELPWLATPKSRLLQTIDYYWNRYWSHDNRVKLCVCGSSASWIIEKIINNKGGLYNRVTRTIRLDPFSLHEVADFLVSMKIKLNHKQILDLYMVFGGIPHYLALINKGYSAYQCIDELCFQKGGELINEFERLFSSLFNNADTYVRIIRAIANHPCGIGQIQLIKESGMSDGGRIKQRLKELEDAGFILGFIPYGHKEKGVYYKVVDEFVLFYLYWVEPNLRTIIKQDRTIGYWLAKTKSSSWKSWSGLAFEAICYKHLAQIRKTLKIVADAQVGSWRYIAKKPECQGAQIDLLFDRSDGVITICEIKYNEQPFAITKEYAQKLLNKIEVYKSQSKTNKQLFLAMITVGGLKATMYSEELISAQVILDDLFEE